MRLGLRAKSALALGSACVLILVLAAIAGWRALAAVEENLGTAYARNVTQYNKQRILTPVLRELALSQRLADSEVTRRWLLDENDSVKKALFFAEAERYQKAFVDKSYFVISGTSRRYYFNDSRSVPSVKPRYSLKPHDPHDAWFFNTMKNTTEFNVNVDPDTKLKVTKVWFNVVVKDHGRNIGLAGTGLDLTTFLKQFITSSDAGVTPMIVNRKGAIQAHPDRQLIDYASINDKGENHNTIFQLLSRESSQRMQRGLEKAAAQASDIEVFWAEINGHSELFAMSFIPELNWYAVTAVDLKTARVVDSRLWIPVLLSGSVLLLLLLAAIVICVNRIVLSPLLKLTGSIRAMASGHYDVPLPRPSSDEIGELTAAFGVMATQVRSHTEELEGKVRERTSELVSVNEQMAAANKKIGDSIEYASLLQNAILPDRELARALPDQHFVLWRPRDVVGGDFYVFHAEEHGYLIGVVDCAGHGVPGACMTMMAHTAINVAVDSLGITSPAAVLRQVDERMHGVLRREGAEAQLATHMDAGLAYVDLAGRTITFAGAKISLYWCDGSKTGQLSGERRALGGTRGPEISNRSMALDPHLTYYMTTDGLLDQAGGDRGFSFGNRRFEEILLSQALSPLARQQEALAAALAVYQGECAQRDDITVLGFRVAEARMSG